MVYPYKWSAAGQVQAGESPPVRDRVLPQSYASNNITRLILCFAESVAVGVVAM